MVYCYSDRTWRKRAAVWFQRTMPLQRETEIPLLNKSLNSCKRWKTIFQLIFLFILEKCLTKHGILIALNILNFKLINLTFCHLSIILLSAPLLSSCLSIIQISIFSLFSLFQCLWLSLHILGSTVQVSYFLKNINKHELLSSNMVAINYHNSDVKVFGQ